MKSGRKGISDRGNDKGQRSLSKSNCTLNEGQHDESPVREGHNGKWCDHWSHMVASLEDHDQGSRFHSKCAPTQVDNGFIFLTKAKKKTHLCYSKKKNSHFAFQSFLLLRLNWSFTFFIFTSGSPFSKHLKCHRISWQASQCFLEIFTSVLHILKPHSRALISTQICALSCWQNTYSLKGPETRKLPFWEKKNKFYFLIRETSLLYWSLVFLEWNQTWEAFYSLKKISRLIDVLEFTGFPE